MHKIIALLLISTTLFAADEVGQEFIQVEQAENETPVESLETEEVGRKFIKLKQEENETQAEYFERILPFLPTKKEFMYGKLLGDHIRYRKNNQTIEIKRTDIHNAETYSPSLYDQLIPFLEEDSEQQLDRFH